MNTSGIFQMQDAAKVISMDLSLAKDFALGKVNNSSAKSQAKQKAKMMITRSTSNSKLAFGISNFILSFGDLKVIK